MTDFEQQVAEAYKPSEAAVIAAHDAMLVAQVESGGDEISLKQVLRAAYAVDAPRVAGAIDAAIESIDSGYYFKYYADVSRAPALAALRGNRV